MCTKCDGMTEEQVIQRYVQLIEDHGWAVCWVSGGGGWPPFAYTIGLTRYHDHPELRVSGLEASEATTFLNQLGAEVREGRRYRATEVVQPEGTDHRYLFVRVNSPDELAYAQEIYGLRGAKPVQALQVVWSDHAGNWPWDRRSEHGRGSQHLYGRPRPAAA